MVNVINKLNNLKLNNKYLNDMNIYVEDNVVRISFEYTIYDYDFPPTALFNCLNDMGYELGVNCDWYNSFELHIYVK